MVRAQLQDKAEWKRVLAADPERAALRLSKNQVVGRNGDWEDSKPLRERRIVVKDCGLANLSGLISRKEMRRRRNKKRPRKKKTLRIRPAGRNTAAIKTTRALRLDAIRQKGKILRPTIA
jgi:hypothetical protein